MKKYLIFFLPFVFTGCFEDDERVPPYPGEVTVITHNIGWYQSYFDLETGSVVAYNHINAWDIGFDCAPEGWGLKVNSAKGLFIHATALTDISVPITLTGNESWKYDDPKGDPCSGAFGSWCDTLDYPFSSKEIVYLAGRQEITGYAVVAMIQLVSVDSFRYILRHRNPGDGQAHLAEIAKAGTVNFTYFNLTEKQQKNLEPGKLKYDLVFTPYYDLADNGLGTIMPYLVRGVFLNRCNVTAVAVTTVGYDQFSWNDINSIQLTNRQDVIGYKWKDVSVNFSAGTATYNVVPGLMYAIGSTEGSFYKLRFLSYAMNGINGFPRFEYRMLQ